MWRSLSQNKSKFESIYIRSKEATTVVITTIVLLLWYSGSDASLTETMITFFIM